MLVKQDLINRIKDYFDLNIYETKVWLALLGKGVASASEIAEMSGVPRSRAYDVLESLEKKGFSIVKIGKPVMYMGVKPQIILEKLKNNVRKDANDKIVMLSNIKETNEFTELEDLYKEGVNPVKREDISAAVKGKYNISNYLKEMILESEKEIIICTDAEDFNQKIKYIHSALEKLKKSNIKIKISLSGDEELIKKIETKIETKIKRTAIESKFFIIDKKEILFYLSKTQENEDIAIWLSSEFFAQAFASLFEMANGGK